MWPNYIYGPYNVWVTVKFWLWFESQAGPGSSLSFHSGMWAISHLLSGVGSCAPPLDTFSSLIQPICLIVFTSSRFILVQLRQYQPRYSKRLPRATPYCFTLYNLFYFHQRECQQTDSISRASSLKASFMGKHYCMWQKQ